MFSQKFLRDTAQRCEFFIQLSRIDGSKERLIPLDIIESFENIDGYKFEITVDAEEYYKLNKQKKWHKFNFGIKK